MDYGFNVEGLRKLVEHRNGTNPVGGGREVRQIARQRRGIAGNIDKPSRENAAELLNDGW